MTLWKIARTARRVAQAQSAVRNPSGYARRRATSAALGELGLWRALSKLYRGR